MTQRVSLSYSLSTLLKGETRELFDKITQWKKHQRTAIPVPCFRVLAVSLVDCKDWNSGHHTPPGGVEVHFLWRLGSLAQRCCYSLWSSMMRQKSNEQPFKIAAGLLNEDSRAKATLWDTRQILKPASMVKSLLNPKWWEKLCLKISEERLRNQTMCAFVVATNISPNIPHLYVIISSFYAIPGESARGAAPRCLCFTTAHSKLSFPLKTELSPGCGTTAPLKIVL